jgi:hypothetical protein
MCDIKDKNRMRGRNKISAKLARKQKNIIEAQDIKEKEVKREEADKKEMVTTSKLSKKIDKKEDREIDQPYNPFHRFMKNS